VYYTAGGQIGRQGEPERTFSRPSHPRTQRFLERVL